MIDNNKKENALWSGYFSDRSNIIVLYSDSTREVRYARNVGLRQVRGKWVICADADDFFHPTAFDAYKNSGTDLIPKNIGRWKDCLACYSGRRFDYSVVN